MKNLKALIESQFGTVFIHSGNEYKIACQRCGKKALWVNPVEGVFNCFGCGIGGRLADLSPFFKHQTKDVQQLLATANKQKTADMSVLPKNYVRVKIRSDFPDGWDYIEGRGVDPSRHEWGFFDQFSVCFPVRENGQIVYWQARSINHLLKRKTKNPWNGASPVTRQEVVFGLENITAGQPTFLVEGVFDSLRSGGVATLGKTCSTVQAIKIVRRRPSFIVVAYDSDTWDRPDGLSDSQPFVPYPMAAVRTLSSVDRTVPAVAVRLPDGRDPADMGMRRLVKHTVKEAMNDRLEYHATCDASVRRLVTQLQDSLANAQRGRPSKSGHLSFPAGRTAYGY